MDQHEYFRKAAEGRESLITTSFNTPIWHEFCLVRKLQPIVPHNPDDASLSTEPPPPPPAISAEKEEGDLEDEKTAPAAGGGDDIQQLEKRAEAWAAHRASPPDRSEAAWARVQAIVDSSSSVGEAVKQEELTQVEKDMERYFMASATKMLAEQELRMAKRRMLIATKALVDKEQNVKCGGMPRIVENTPANYGLPAKEILTGLVYQGSYHWLRDIKTNRNIQHVVNCAWELDYGMLKSKGLHVKDVVIDCRLKEMDYERLHPMLYQVYEYQIAPRLQAKEPIYVCCIAGRNRSAIVAAYIVSRFLVLPFQDVLDKYVQRPGLELSPSFLAQCN